ncbi:MAG: macrolide family glycosyltransferase [Pseudonocardiaceae bacterium]
MPEKIIDPLPEALPRRHVLITSVPAHGHVNPTVAMVRELVRRGHRVTYATQERFRTVLDPVGAQLLPTRFELPVQRLDRDRFSGRLDFFADMLRSDLPAVVTALERDQPDVIGYDMMTPLGSALAARWGVPAVRLVPTLLDNRHTVRRELQTGTSVPTRAGLADSLRGLRRVAGELGLSMSAVLTTMPSADGNVVFLPRQFQPCADTFEASGHTFVGPSPTPPSPVDRNWSAPVHTGRLLYVSLGTALPERGELLGLCGRAFHGTGWHVLIASAGEAVPGHDDHPDDVTIRSWVPQAEVLRSVDVFVTHAGTNSAMDALHAGVPTVSLPRTTDQTAIARRLHALGLGTWLAPEDISPRSLRAAVESVWRDTGVRHQLHAMREAIASAGGAAAAADVIERAAARPRGVSAKQGYGTR